MRFSKTLKVQKNLSRRTLWVLEAKIFSMSNKEWLNSAFLPHSLSVLNINIIHFKKKKYTM